MLRTIPHASIHTILDGPIMRTSLVGITDRGKQSPCIDTDRKDVLMRAFQNRSRVSQGYVRMKRNWKKLGSRNLIKNSYPDRVR